MPRQDKHLRKARGNEAFLHHLLEGKCYLDWAVTGTFYAALHYIHSYLALTQDFHPDNYLTMEQSIRRVGKLRPILRQYRWLKDSSQTARYQCRHFKFTEVEAMVQGELRDIREHITSISSRR